jgi:HEAT repeat protein
VLPRLTTIPLAALLAWIGAAPAAAAPDLPPQDVERLRGYGPHWGLAGATAQSALAEAGRDFAGRAAAVADHFLKHPDSPAPNTAYFFVLRAVGDRRAALVLIQALSDPPKAESGKWNRDPSEVRIAAEAVLGNEDVRGDPEVVAALVSTAVRSRARPYGGDAASAVLLLGKCRGLEARVALEGFTMDADPAVRSAAAQALGELGAARPAAGSSPAPADSLGRVLLSDRSVEARLQAAFSLAGLESPEAIDRLREAIQSERDPRVVDAIVAALGRLHSLPAEPQVCRLLAGRCWEASSARPLFLCWHSSASREEVLEAASAGPPVLRALALGSLAPPPSASPELVGYRMRVASAPPPPGPGGASRPSAALLTAPPQPAVSPPPSFEPATRDRLLRSAVEVLSHEVVALPKEDAIAYTTAQAARDAFWEISGRDIGVALRYADTIRPAATHYTGSGRYGASDDLWRRDPRGYVAYRRPRQLLALVPLILPALVLAGIRRTRRGGIFCLAALLMWGTWTQFQETVRELPPPPLKYLTVSGIAFLAAGAVSALATMVPRTSLRQRPLRALAKALAASVAAGAAALVVCGWTRSSHYFPVGGEGWELLFDPVASALLAAAGTFVLALVHMVVPDRVAGGSGSQPQ